MGREGLSPNSSFATRIMNLKREGYKKASSDVVQLTESGLSPFDNCVHFSSTCPVSPQVLPLLGSAGARQGQVTLSSSTALLLHVLSCGKYMEFFKIKWLMHLLCPFQRLGHHLSHRMQGEEERSSPPALGP